MDIKRSAVPGDVLLGGYAALDALEAVTLADSVFDGLDVHSLPSSLMSSSLFIASRILP